MSEDYKWRYGFFLGCVIPNRYPMLEVSIRNVFDHLGAELLDLPGASCCPAPGVFRAFHIPTWLVIAARNISIAEELGVSPITGCNGCYGTLRDAWYELEHDYDKKKEINEYLAKIGRIYKGNHEPKHIIQAFYLDMGLDYLKDFIKLTFSDLKVGVHYGCHIVKPSEKRPWNGEYEAPKFLDEIVEITGAKSIDYKDKYMCCGAGGAVRTAVKEVAADFTREKLVNMRDAGVDIIINCCPFCELQFDLGQIEVNNFYADIIGEPFNIPVIYITQLLGLAFGMDPNLLGLVKNHNLTGVSPFISYEPFLNIVKEQLI
ncbi:MAG: CoB--CoM heterodisulfide reductase subunit B [Candidatus Lokiarchaeota archaeon]|nr:CoB--CoM heterodisulfide reductase subunit B [Candidatus Lokiarchaeota archaeon]